MERGAIAERPHGRRRGRGAHPRLLAGRYIREVDTEAGVSADEAFGVEIMVEQGLGVAGLCGLIPDEVAVLARGGVEEDGPIGLHVDM